MNEYTYPRDRMGTNYDEMIRKAMEDLDHFDTEFNKFFKDRMSKYQMNTKYLFRTVNEGVSYTGEVIDVAPLLPFVQYADHQLFSDVCKFTYQFVEGKPASDNTLKQFCALLTKYLSAVGF